MSSQTSSGTTSSGGIGICSLLGVAFIILKLCGVIAWPWIWVLAPFWVPLALTLVFLAFISIVFLIVGVAHATTVYRAQR